MIYKLKCGIGVALIRLGWRIYMHPDDKREGLVGCCIEEGGIGYSIHYLYKEDGEQNE